MGIKLLVAFSFALSLLSMIYYSYGDNFGVLLSLLACILAIFARMTQSSIQHQELKDVLKNVLVSQVAHQNKNKIEVLKSIQSMQTRQHEN
jgi:hypothetical protein